jgi:phosphatidylserine decarboxylase
MEALVNIGIEAQKYLPGFVSEKFTKNICSLIGKSTRKADKLRYATTYKIDWKQARKCKGVDSLEMCIDKFKTVNDLFARKIDPSLTRPEKNGQYDIISPAESYVRVESADSEFNIKGAKYSVKKLLDREDVPQHSHIFIFRLAPDQYHRFHSPTTSKVVKIKEVGGAYRSVNPILLDTVSVLQENYRKIVDFENGIVLVAIGATCVGSVKLSIKTGSKVKHGDDIGYFEFGGSCIALVVPHKQIKKLKKINKNETFIDPGKWVCTFKPSTY